MRDCSYVTELADERDDEWPYVAAGARGIGTGMQDWGWVRGCVFHTRVWVVAKADNNLEPGLDEGTMDVSSSSSMVITA